MNRRDVVLAVLALGAAPFTTLAQQISKPFRVGYVSVSTLDRIGHLLAAFKEGLRDLGYVEGKDFILEARSAEGEQARVQSLTDELVRLKVDFLLASTTPAIQAARNATATIPIVMANSTNPVGTGLIKSLARPSGNVTGMSGMFEDIMPKHLDVLHTLIPKLSRVAVLTNGANSSHAEILKSVEAAARTSRTEVVAVAVNGAPEIERALAAAARLNAKALLMAPDGLFFAQRRRLADLALIHRLPSITSFREYAEAGGLMSYGQNLKDAFRRSAAIVDKILKGTKPGDIPVEQSMRIEMVINLKTAKALGVNVPQSVLIRADEVIQ